MPQETQDNVLPNTEMVFTCNMVRERVEAAAHKIFGVADMNDDTSFEADLGGDTLDFVEFIMELEEEFGIVIPEYDANTMFDGCVVGKIREYIEKRLRDENRLED